MKKDPIIVHAMIDVPTGFFALPVVNIKLDTGEYQKLFDYFPDEISFQPSEFLGLTIREANQLKFNKDKAYLQS